MSLILDALRRSEGGGLAASPQPVGPEERTGWAQKKWLAGVVLVCAGLGVATGWIVRGGITEPIHDEQVAIPVSRSPSSVDAAVSSNVPRLDVPPPSAGAAQLEAAPSETKPASDSGAAESENIAALHQQMWADAASFSEAEGQGSDQPGATISEDKQRNALMQTEESPAAVSPNVPSVPTSIAPPIDLVAAIERAAREVGEPSLVPHPAVLLENLSQQQKDQIPTIVYTEHAYAGSASPSVELNGQRLRPGQRTGPITVEDILVDSVILRVNGVSFRLRALNTWVNL